MYQDLDENGYLVPADGTKPKRRYYLKCDEEGRISEDYTRPIPFDLI